MLCNLWEVAHLENLIKGYHILQFYFIEGGMLILEDLLYFTINLITELL